MADLPDSRDPSDQKALAPRCDETPVTPVAASNPGAARDRLLTREDFQRLAAVPAEAEWFANIENPQTRRAYRTDLMDFARFVGLARPEDMRLVTRAHIIAWRDHLKQRDLAGSTIRRKLAALSSLFEYLAEKNAVADNPVSGVKRPKAPALPIDPGLSGRGRPRA